MLLLWFQVSKVVYSLHYFFAYNEYWWCLCSDIWAVVVCRGSGEGFLGMGMSGNLTPSTSGGQNGPSVPVLGTLGDIHDSNMVHQGRLVLGPLGGILGFSGGSRGTSKWCLWVPVIAAVTWLAQSQGHWVASVSRLCWHFLLLKRLRINWRWEIMIFTGFSWPCPQPHTCVVFYTPSFLAFQSSNGHFPIFFFKHFAFVIVFFGCYPFS